MLRDEEPIAQLQYWLNSYSKYNIPPKALPLLICTKNAVLGDVSRDKCSTRLRLVLYLSLDTPPCAVFSIQTRGSALSNIYCTLHGRIKGTKCALFSMKCKGAVWKKHSYEVN